MTIIHQKKVVDSKIMEIIILIAIIISILVAFSLDIKTFELPEVFYMKYEDEVELINILLTVQASTLSISIALISLLTATLKECIYGVSVTKYVMQDAPYIFKHNYIIISCLVIILSNFICVAMNFFNISIDLFFVSILLLILLYKDVIKIFTEKDKTDALVKAFIISNYTTKKYLLNNFKNALNSSIETQNTSEIKKNYNLLSELFMCELKTETKDNVGILEDICVESYLIGFPQNNYRLNSLCLKNMLEIYKKVNDNTTMDTKPIPLTIWDKISLYFYRILPKTNFEDSFDDNFISDLYFQLYKNMDFSENKHYQKFMPKNCLDLDYWSARVYLALFVNNYSEVLEKKQHEISVMLFKNAELQAKYITATTFKDERREIATNELALYIKILIDNLQERVLEECILNSRYFDFTNDTKIIPKVLIYLYYIGFREKIIINNGEGHLNKNNQEFTASLLKKHHSLFSQYLYRYIESISAELSYLKKQLKSWEYFPQLSSKWIIMDKVVEDFIIWSIVITVWEEDKIRKILKSIIEDREFHYFNQYFGDSKEDSFNNYLIFIDAFFGESFNVSHFSDKYKRFETIMIELYKNSEIATGKTMALSEEKENDFTKKVEIAFQNEVDKTFEYFKFQNDEILQPIAKQIHLKPIQIPVSIMNDEFIDNFLSEYLNQCAFSYLNLIIEDIIKPKTVIMNSEGKIFSFLQEVLKIDSIDMIIGNLNLFSGEKYFDVIEEFCKDKIIIQDTNYGDKIFAINSAMLEIKINDIEAKLTDYSEVEFNSICKYDEDGKILYNITNSILIPFEKEELLVHIHNTKKNLVITSNVKYHTKNEKIGAGIVVSFDS